MALSTGKSGGRPTLFGQHWAISTGHYLATEIAADILRRGGNAFDAAVAAGFALQVLKPHQNGFAGENPMLLHHADSQRTMALSGNGCAPAAATLEYFRDTLNLRLIPGDGFLPATVPPAPGSYLFLLKTFGTLPLADVLQPAMALAGDGHIIHDSLHDTIRSSAERFRHDWPGSAALYLSNNEPLPAGELLRNADLARTMRRLIEAAASRADREAGIDAAYELFYRGEIAREIVDFAGSFDCPDATGRSHRALLTMADMAAWSPKLEAPTTYNWRGMRIVKCPPWTQGPVMLLALAILEQFDLSRLEHNSADYLHLLTEAQKLAYADRETTFGDPDFVNVPMARMLSAEYAARRAGQIDPQRASLALRPGSGPEVTDYADSADIDAAMLAAAGDGTPHGDTTKLDIIDSRGNAISITTSGGWLQSSPVIPGLGFPLGTRGQMFSLSDGHPNVIAPGKRPRTTLTPTLALRHGRPLLAFGSPGGDCQDQWALQFLLNHVHFGMSLQEAVDAPTVWSAHCPISFYPRHGKPAQLHAESRIDCACLDDLSARGHRLIIEGPFSGGNTLAVRFQPPTDAAHAAIYSAAASPRLDPAYALVR